MKRKNYVVMLIMILALTGCGKSQRSDEPVVGSDTLQMPSIENSDTTQIEQLQPAQTENNTEYQPHSSNGEAGHGTIEDIYKYWEQNGYPEYVSYAYEAGGEVLDDDTVVSFWEIGIVNSDDTMQQEILDLLSPTCFVTFFKCSHSHAERLKAYNSIMALNDTNIIRVNIGENTESIFVIFDKNLTEEQQKEYASKLIKEYGTFIVVSDDNMQNALTGVLDTGTDME